MTNRSKTLVLFCLIVLGSCNAPKLAPDNIPAAISTSSSSSDLLSESIEYCSPDLSYCLSYSNSLEQQIGEQDFPVFTTRKSHREFEHEDYYVQLYESSPSCSPSSLGISQPEVDEVKDGESVMWGKVDAYLGDMYPVPEPNCMVNPPYTQMAVSYMLCAEKMGKRVAICVMQVTDDQEAAEEIFSSFRWVKL